MGIHGKKICAIIEARMTSSRLPGKVLMDYCGKSNLEHIIERLSRSSYLDDVVVATTINQTDEKIIELCENKGIAYYRGSEEDVLLRVLDTAKSVEADIIVEITGDCPVIDWRHVDYLIEFYFEKKVDYVSNIIERSFPRGFDVQVFSTEILEKVNQMTQSPVDHEHVSLYIYTHPEIFTLANWFAPIHLNHPEIEITLDTQADYELIREIYEALYPQNIDFSSADIMALLAKDERLNKLAQKKERVDAIKARIEWDENDGKTI